MIIYHSTWLELKGCSVLHIKFSIYPYEKSKIEEQFQKTLSAVVHLYVISTHQILLGYTGNKL